ncbi:MAG: hypothetical protein IJZ95_07155 [Oscillospiraceae bacterium]|nr:hypothetical protein [Oscillospiraceae bacterium]
MSKYNSNDILDNFSAHTEFFVYDGKLYIFDHEHHCYVVVPSPRIPTTLMKSMPLGLRREIPNGVFDDAKTTLLREPLYEVDLEELKLKGVYYINLKNGVFDVRTGKLIKGKKAEELVKSLRFTYALNFSYSPNVALKEKDMYLQFLRDSLDYDTCPEKSILLSEILGVSVSSLRDVRKATFLVGATRSGKSIIADLVKRVHFPKSCVSFLGFHQLGGNFETIKLLHSRVNICKEISTRKIPRTEIIKQLISHEDVYLQEKMQVGFPGVPHCQLLSCGNILPQFGEMDASGNEALIDRMVVLHFGHSIPTDKLDRQLVDKLWAERDLIFSLALDALAALYQRNYEFTMPADSKALLEGYAQQSRSFEAFVEECCQLEGKIHSDTLFKAYHQYCKDNCFKSYSDHEVRAYIGNSLPQVLHKKFTLNGNYRWGWEGLSLKVEEIIKED